MTKEARSIESLNLSLDHQRLVLATGIILDRLRRLSPEDSADLFEMVRVYQDAETEEELSAADQAIMEILEQASPTAESVKTLDLTHTDKRGRAELTPWIDWVSKEIRTRRGSANLTQKQLAERSGLPQSHISRIETGRHSPSRGTLEKIARALGIPVGKLDPTTA